MTEQAMTYAVRITDDKGQRWRLFDTDREMAAYFAQEVNATTGKTAIIIGVALPCEDAIAAARRVAG
ncbi:MAG: hypothetical protein AAFQ90_10585 [Pseudomonadota bacterium]